MGPLWCVVVGRSIVWVRSGQAASLIFILIGGSGIFSRWAAADLRARAGASAIRHGARPFIDLKNTNSN